MDALVAAVMVRNAVLVCALVTPQLAKGATNEIVKRDVDAALFWLELVIVNKWLTFVDAELLMKTGNAWLVNIVLSNSVLIKIYGAARAKWMVMAVETGSVALVELLVEKKVAVNLTYQKDKLVRGSRALYDAISNNNTAMAKVLLDAGADPNSGTRGGHSVAVEAYCNGNPDILELLINRGADIDRESMERWIRYSPSAPFIDNDTVLGAFVRAG